MSQVAFPRMKSSPVLPSAEQVHVDVVNELATATTHVHPETIPLCDNVPLRCQVFRDHEELAHQHDMLLLQIVNSSNMQLRDDQDMYRCLGIDVPEGHDLIVFVHNTGRCTLGDDLTENTRHGRWYPPFTVAPRARAAQSAARCQETVGALRPL